MAYVPEIGEFEDGYLGRRGGSRNIGNKPLYIYSIKGKDVSEAEYYNTLNALAEPLIKDLKAKLMSGNITNDEKEKISKQIKDIYTKIENQHNMLKLRWRIR
jgi:hypothetical protein